MAKQDVVDRIHNFYEVALGYTEEQAKREATRCLQCPNPRCVQGCPVNIDIPAFIKEIKDGNYRASAAKLKEFNSLPAVCGRVCPQENQCQELCVLGKMGDPISIGRLERFAADWERNAGVELPEKQVEGATGKVAIVGSGPAGLTVAADLIKQGHEVVMFESLHYAGGVLMYGIPQF
ncbi:MAG TPA: dihydropyrimidine dehydrogenase, partial [Candidatus Bathyarchaeota archaeon]|nr:dihydropyrimidine dehydrogenase [Candidatus Bathyarchaeota archaeon]